jgi:hypothetical protein
MQLGITREFWTKFQEFLKSLSISNKIQKILVALVFLKFLFKFHFKFEKTPMIKLVPWLEICHQKFFFKFFELGS